MVPLAAALVMAGGPAVFAAQSHCRQRAAEELARQKAAQQTPPGGSQADGDVRSTDSLAGASGWFRGETAAETGTDTCAESGPGAASDASPVKSTEPRSSDSSNACFVAAGAKPVDTHGAAQALRPADSIVRDCGRHRCRHLIIETDSHLPSELHRPAYQALAPPIC